MQIKEGKKEYIQIKFIANLSGKKRKIRVNCKSGTIKKCNKQTKLKNKNNARVI